jgi:signal transduction histidine kinase
MFFKSIRWRLQIWYGLILVGVLAGFGFTAQQLQRGKQFRRIDDELQRRVGELASALRLPPRREPGLPDEGRREDFPERPLGPGSPPIGSRPPPNDGPFDGEPPETLTRAPTGFRLRPQQARLFDESDTNGFFYVVWARDGRELARSANAPNALPMPGRSSSMALSAPRMREGFREISLSTPPGEVLLAGRSVALELKDLRRASWLLSGTGGVILLLGLAGGWWIASRAIQPIEDISATAVQIAAGDLSKRINAADADSELGRLAGVLNSTFARLESAFEEQKQFTSDAAHELRTPVSVVLTQTQTALMRERTAAEYRETVESCQRAAQRMRRLIEALLELARLDAGQEQLKRLPFDLSRTVQDCVQLIRPLADERHVEIKAELSRLECMGDPDRLAQVITNLLTNAIHYNKENGDVRLAAHAENGSATLTVTDTGEGIPAEDLPHIFRRFYRADKSRTAGRTGLGLAISKAIVESHGGTLQVASQLGVGTIFTLRLPLG